jgi:hypothetical protein
MATTSTQKPEKPYLKPEIAKLLVSILLFIVVMVVFGWHFRYCASGDTIPNELLPITIITKGSLDFNGYVDYAEKLPYWYREINGKIVSAYPIVPGLLNLPTYLIAHCFGVDLMQNKTTLSMITSMIISALSVVFMYLCLTKICKTRLTAVFFALVYAFATAVWSVTSRGLWQHGPSLLFITISLSFLLDNNPKLIPYSGFFLGMAVFNRPTNILIAAPLSIYVSCNHRKSVLKFLLMAAVPAFFLCLYSFSYLGSILALGQEQGISGFKGDLLTGFCGLLISPSRGLLVFSPIFVFSLPYLFYSLFSRKVEPIYRYLTVSIILFILVYSKWSIWWGGHCFGYRLLIETVPIMIIFLVFCWNEAVVKHKLLLIIFMVLLAISVYIHFLGARYYPGEFSFNALPNNIDQHDERLWYVTDTEITRLSSEFIRKTLHR